MPQELSLQAMSKMPFDVLDAIVRQHGCGFLAVGNALIAIRDSHGYAPHFKSFPAYVADRLGYSKAEAYKIIKAAQIADAIHDKLGKDDVKLGTKSLRSETYLPHNPRQALQLAKLPEDQRVDCWFDVVEEAKADDKPITEKLVSKKVVEYLEASGEPLEQDEPRLGDDEEEDDNLLPEILSAVNSGKLKATPAQLTKLAEFEQDVQRDMLEACLAGRTTVAKCIAEGCAPEPTIDEQVKAQASEIEKKCREIIAYIEQAVTSLDDPWIDHLGARKLALEEFKKGCDTLRSCKSVAACPKCGGEGCSKCLKTGRVNRFTLQQLS